MTFVSKHPIRLSNEWYETRASAVAMNAHSCKSDTCVSDHEALIAAAMERCAGIEGSLCATPAGEPSGIAAKIGVALQLARDMAPVGEPPDMMQALMASALCDFCAMGLCRCHLAS